MCFGKQKVEQTNKTILSPEQQKLVNMGTAGLESASANTPQVPKTLGFDPLQTSAQNQMLQQTGAGGNITATADTLGNAQQFLLGDVLDINKNPALQRTIDASVRPLTENFQSVVMPGLRTEAVQAGALGGSRNKLAGQTAANMYQRQVGDTAAGVATDAYKSGLQAMVQGTALAPQSMQAMLFPAAAQEAVGTQRRELATQQGNDALNQSNFDWNRALQTLNAAGGIPGGGSTGTVTPASQGPMSWLSQGLGAVSLLAGLL